MKARSLLLLMLLSLLQLPAANEPHPPAPLESPEEFLAQFNEWYQSANAYVASGHARALREVVLEEGEEWGCEWPISAKRLILATRNAIRSSLLLDDALRVAWLEILDQAQRDETVYGVGTLLVMDGYSTNVWGEKISGFILEPNSVVAEGNRTRCRWTLDTYCGGMAMPGAIEVTLGKNGDREVLCAARFVGE